MWWSLRHSLIHCEATFRLRSGFCRAPYNGCTSALGEAFPERSPCRTCVAAPIGRASLFCRTIDNRPPAHTIRRAFQNSSMPVQKRFLSALPHRRWSGLCRVYASPEARQFRASILIGLSYLHVQRDATDLQSILKRAYGVVLVHSACRETVDGVGKQSGSFAAVFLLSVDKLRAFQHERSPLQRFSQSSAAIHG
jgi:hypothetical protein